MNKEEMVDKWREIIETANAGDPQYSFKLFSGLLEDSKK